MSKTTIGSAEFQSLIIYSMRYTIARMSYATIETGEIIIKYMDYIDINTLDVLIKDIERELAIVGMYFDKTRWLELLETLKNERDRRKAIDRK